MDAILIKIKYGKAIHPRKNPITIAKKVGGMMAAAEATANTKENRIQLNGVRFSIKC